MTVIILPQSRQNGQTAAARLTEEMVKPCVLYSLSVSFYPFLFLCAHFTNYFCKATEYEIFLSVCERWKCACIN